MKKKMGWHLIVVLILGLALLAISCGGATQVPTEEPKAEEPKVEEPVAEEPATTAGPSTIPAGHATAACAACHEQGIGGASKSPDNHTSFTEEMCTSCHKPAE
ncbi:hypothetical protein ACFLWO_01405 [Chloroflexota bacterium]